MTHYFRTNIAWWRIRATDSQRASHRSSLGLDNADAFLRSIRTKRCSLESPISHHFSRADTSASTAALRITSLISIPTIVTQNASSVKELDPSCLVWNPPHTLWNVPAVLMFSITLHATKRISKMRVSGIRDAHTA